MKAEMEKKIRRATTSSKRPSTILRRNFSFSLLNADNIEQSTLLSSADSATTAVSYHQSLVDVISGVCACFLQLVFSISYTAGIFSSREPLQSMLGIGTYMTAIAVIIAQIMYAWRSDIPYMFVGPDIFYVPLMCGIAETLSTFIDVDTAVGLDIYRHTFLFTLVASTLTVGLSKTIFGTLGLASFADYTPYPVICGLIAGIGVNLIQIAVKLCVVKSDGYPLLPLVPSVTFAVFSYVSTAVFHLNQSTTFLMLIVGSVLVFYCVAYFLGLSLSELRLNGWLLNMPMASSAAAATSSSFSFVGGSSTAEVESESGLWLYLLNEASNPRVLCAKIDFVAFSHCLTSIVALSLLMVFKITLALPGYEKVFKTRYDKSRELQKYGLATMIAGLFGGVATCPAISILSMVVEMGGSERGPVVVAPMAMLLFCFSGFAGASLAPKFLFAGMLFSSGLSMIIAWFINPFFRISYGEFGILLTIVTVYLSDGMLVAIGVGSALSLLLLSLKFHDVGCVKFVSNGNVLHSTVNRTDGDTQVLNKVRHRLRILQLQGYIAFANVNQILDILLVIFDRADALSTAYQHLGETSHPVPDSIKSTEEAGALKQQWMSQNASYFGYLHPSQAIADLVEFRKLQAAETSAQNQQAQYQSLEEGELVGDRVESSLDDDHTQVDTRFGKVSVLSASAVDPSDFAPPYAIIIHMSAVTGCDASAMDVLNQVGLICLQRKCKLILAAVPKTVQAFMGKAGLLQHKHIVIVEDLDEGLALLEEMLLRHYKPIQPAVCLSSDSDSRLASLDNQYGDYSIWVSLFRESYDFSSSGFEVGALSYFAKYMIACSFKFGEHISRASPRSGSLISISPIKSRRGEAMPPPPRLPGFFFLVKGGIRLIQGQGLSQSESEPDVRVGARDTLSPLSDLELRAHVDATLSSEHARDCRYAPGFFFEDVVDSALDFEYVCDTDRCHMLYLPGSVVWSALVSGDSSVGESVATLYRAQHFLTNRQLFHCREYLANMKDVLYFHSE